MKEKWERVPKALQKQVFRRLVPGAGFLLLLVVILACFRDVYLGLPCLLFAAILLGTGGWLFCQGAEGNYICIRGTCRQVETTGIRKRVKCIRVTLDKNTLTIPVWQGMIRPASGDTVIVYLSDKTPVYGQDADYMICSYYAMEIQREV